MRSHFLSVCRSARNGFDGRDEHDDRKTALALVQEEESPH